MVTIIRKAVIGKTYYRVNGMAQELRVEAVVVKKIGPRACKIKVGKTAIRSTYDLNLKLHDTPTEAIYARMDYANKQIKAHEMGIAEMEKLKIRLQFLDALLESSSRK